MLPAKIITSKFLSKKIISINDLRTPFGVNQQVLITLFSELRILPVVIPFKNFLASFPVIEKQSNFSSQNFFFISCILK